MYRQKTRSRHYGITILLIMIVGLGAGEAIVRLFSKSGYVTPELLRHHEPQYENTIYARHAIKAMAQLLNNPERPQVPINSAGYRGEEFKRQKPAKTIRIVIYGGSAVFDRMRGGLSDWPHQVETQLAQFGLTHVEVINAGIAGHSSVDSLGRLLTEGYQWQADYIILYNTWNDIKYFNSTQPLLRLLHPEPLDQDPIYYYRNRWDQRLCEWSQLYVRLRYRYFMKIKPRDEEGANLCNGRDPHTINSEQLQQFRLSVSTFIDLTRSLGAKPILMTQARLLTNMNDTAAKAQSRAEFACLDHATLLKAYDAAEEIIRDLAKTKWTPLIDISKSMSGNHDYFVDHVHLSVVGSQALATNTAQYLQRILPRKSE